MARTTSRIPLQPRSVGIAVNGIKSSTSSSSSDEGGGGFASKDYVNRLSTLESSNNDNNKRIASSSSMASSSTSLHFRRGSSSSSLGGGGMFESATSEVSAGGRSATSARPGRAPFPRTTPDPFTGTAAAKSSSSSLGDDEVMIEEKRRRVDGEGHTYHQYLRGKMLGKGGFAKVYMCTALDTNKNYAVKIVPKANLVKARARQKLQTEIKIHRTLKHKHVCAYKHFFEDKVNCYILLELCHNQSMNEMIKRRKRLTEPEAAFFMKQLIEAVEYMHENCVIHRDLKLGNLFLDKNLNIKVGDLGLATRLENVEEKRKTICGTPNYIAPEVIQGTKETRGHSFEVDVWSMGVILYTILVGKPPYEAKDVKATYQRIIANEYSFPSHVPISEHARGLIESMLQSNPRMRPSLEMIQVHSFFTAPDAKMPSALPPNATRVAPEWRVNKQGELVAFQEHENAGRSAEGKVLHRLPRSKSAPRRQPFGDRNANGEQKTQSDGRTTREVCDVRGVLRAAAKTVSKNWSGFQIYDESDTASTKDARRSSHSSSRHTDPTPGSIADLTSKAAALILETERLTKEHDAISELGTTKQQLPVDSDSEILFNMLDRVSAVLESAEKTKDGYNMSRPRPVSHAGPTLWVSRYVDYTTKYGMGFLLKDGSSGVYFNDSTKAVLDKDGETFQYIERRKPIPGSSDITKRQPEPIIETHTLTSYPGSLQKKVTLLKHFHTYLLEQQKKDSDDFFYDASDDSAEESSLPLVYLKKWVRTKHAVLFRLSDQTVQIVFYDQTEVLLTPDERYLTYVDKKQSRCTYFLTNELVASNPELAKRLRYSKEILNTLMSGQKR